MSRERHNYTLADGSIAIYPCKQDDVATSGVDETLFVLPHAQDDVGSHRSFKVDAELLVEAVFGWRGHLSQAGRILALRFFAARWGEA